VDVIHPQPAGDALDDGQILRLDQRDDVRPLRFDHFGERIGAAFAAVEDVVAQHAHASRPSSTDDAEHVNAATITPLSDLTLVNTFAAFGVARSASYGSCGIPAGNELVPGRRRENAASRQVR
jgi:hypothetical protein